MLIRDFVRQSNQIEGIFREPLESEVEAHQRFLSSPAVTIGNLVQFVNAVQPDSYLRNMPGMDVSVGRYKPPPGGPTIVETLDQILQHVARGKEDHIIFMIHYLYENLHPFTDGNGRSGRVLWLWMMGGQSERLFLHEWYYQSLRTQITSFAPHPNLSKQRNTDWGFNP